MNKTQLVGLLALTLITSISVTSSDAFAESRRGGSGSGFSLGISTVEPAGTGNGTSVTGLFNFTAVDSLQVLFAIPTTTGNFNIFGSGLYKRTILGNKQAGLHVGGGVGAGAVAGNFSFLVAALGGFHFDVPNLPQVSVHLDAGPAFQFTDTSPSTTTNFRVSALSSALGLSVFYNF